MKETHKHPCAFATTPSGHLGSLQLAVSRSRTFSSLFLFLSSFLTSFLLCFFFVRNHGSEKAILNSTKLSSTANLRRRSTVFGQTDRCYMIHGAHMKGVDMTPDALLLGIALRHRFNVADVLTMRYETMSSRNAPGSMQPIRQWARFVSRRK